MTADLATALPEILLGSGALALLLIGLFAGARAGTIVSGLAIALLVIVAGVVAARGPAAPAFHGAYIADDFARLMKLLSLVSAAAALLMSLSRARAEKLDQFEYPVLIVLATLGMMVMISAGDLIALYVGLELQSLALYVVAAMNRDNLRSTEAGLKYFVLGALSSGMLLYGASLIYGFTGHTEFSGIAAQLKAHGVSIGIVFGIVFVLAGLAFKIAAVPFHMWTPDVYEGSPTPVTAFFSAAPKIAAMALIVRVVVSGLGPAAHDWRQIIVFISIASMLLGAFAAINQRNIKRLMAYSSIGHMGYALVGLAAGTAQGVESVILYVGLYAAMTLGAFCCILAMERDGDAVEDIGELAGLSRDNPVLAFLFAMILFSLAGIPVLAGFFAKLYVFQAAIAANLTWLAVIGALASVVGAYYYLRIVKIMYFDEPARAFSPMALELKLVLAATSVVVIGFFFGGSPFVGAAAAAAKSLF
jgi:NADH-quinone oxidoreductase subunit N